MTQPTGTLKQDFSASIVVFFVAVPLCLGIALASGAPLFAGLISGVIGGIVVGAISGSPLGVSGPAAGLAVIVLAAIESLGFEAFLLAVVIGGAIQVAIRLNNLTTKVLGDRRQRRHARLNHFARRLIGINRINAELTKGLGNGAFATANTAGQANDQGT